VPAALVGEKAERRARIEGKYEVKVVGDVDDLAVAQGAADEVFGPLVYQHDDG